MKKVQQIILGLLLIPLVGFSQLKSPYNELLVNTIKTSSLAFPYAIVSVDKGSEAIVVEKAKGVENILLVKAYENDFEQTNLTIVTQDGNMYSFLVSYSHSSPDIVRVITVDDAVEQEVVFSSSIVNKKTIEQHADLCYLKTKKLTGLRKKEFDIQLEVTGIYIHEDLFYFRLELENASIVKFEVEQLRFFIRDQKKSKRTASQELEMHAYEGLPLPENIPNLSTVILVAVVPKFTISDKKNFIIQLVEKNGTRQVALKLKKNILSKIVPL